MGEKTHVSHCMAFLVTVRPLHPLENVYDIQYNEGSLTVLLPSQAMVTAGEAAAAGSRRHGGQTASDGGPKDQHPQIGAGCLRPSHDPSEPSTQ